MKVKILLNGIKAALIAALFVLSPSAIEWAPNASAKQIAPKAAVTKNKKMKNAKISNTFATPDFAYPETVTKNARPEWEKALAQGNGLVALQAGLQLVVANNLVNTGDFNRNIEMLDSAVRIMPPVYSALFRLLQADLYMNLYKKQKWVYDQRILPTDTYPADPTSWSRELFAKRVFELVMRGTDNPSASRAMPLKAISTVLTDDKAMLEAGCSVNDFIVFKSISILSNFSTTPQEILPFGKPDRKGGMTYTDRCSELATTLIDNLIKYREKSGNDAALVLAVTAKKELMEVSEKGDVEKFLKEWKDKLIDSPYAGRVLADYFNTRYNSVLGHTLNRTAEEGRAYFYQMQGWLAKYPEAEGAGAVRYCVAEMSQPEMSVSLPSDTYPGKEIKGRVTMDNMEKGYLLIYRVPTEYANENFNVSKFPGNSRFLKAVEVSAKGEIPFSENVEVSIGVMEAGAYLVVPSKTPTLAKNWKSQNERWSMQPINVSEIALFTLYDSQEEKSGKIYVVDAMSQKPVKGAAVRVLGNNNNEISRGETDDDGSFPLPEGYSRSYATLGNSTAYSYSSFHTYKRESKARKQATLLPDLSIYRPGDEVRFVMVEWLNEHNSNRLLKKEKVDVVLRDANWNAVDTLKLETDSYGRANGSFTLPKTGLLGIFCLVALEPGTEGNQLGIANFEVADYKTPGFLVTLEKNGAEETSTTDSVTFKGNVKTYSGMPLENTKVNYNITWRPWWRWGGTYSNATFNGTLTTDSKGEFRITLPSGGVKGTPFEHGIFTIVAEATSPSGETQKSQDVRFTIGNAYSVRPSFKEKMCVETDTIRLNVPVYDMLDLPVIKDVEYKITRDEEGEEDAPVIKEGKFKSPLLELPATLLPSGKYRLTFNLVGDTIKSNEEIVFYRNNDTKPPYSTALWLPETTIVAPEGTTTTEVTFGSSFTDSWVLAVVSAPSGILSSRWINLSDSNRKLEVEAPRDNSKIWVNLRGMRDFNQSQGTVTIEPASSRNRMEVKASTFRDRMTACTTEKWKFTFSIGGTSVANLPAFAVMTDKALNAIRPFAWSFNPEKGEFYNTIRGAVINNRTVRLSATFGQKPEYVGFEPFIPSWNTYGYGLGMDRVYSMRYASRAMGVKAEEAQMEGVNCDMMVDLAEPMVMNSAAPVMAQKRKASADSAATTEEIARVEEIGQEDGGNGASTEKQELRPMEMPLAFFLPELKGDAEGNVEVEFTVPNFNTTWQFQIFGYDEELLTAGLTLDAVASKRVMVQTNAPRFLRTGDTAEISALIFNNTENKEKLDGEIVVFNPQTGETIYSQHQGAELVEASGNRKISINFTVPSDISAIGIRTIGSSGNFSDGEQTVIAVLPSSTPLIESTQFYMGRDKNDFTVRLPKYPADANLTLRYCSNPVWECVLALPSISTPDSKNVLTLMHALYANKTAGGIIDRFPEVKDGLSRIFADNKNGNGALTSNLEKDEELKSVALGSTPWVNNGASETQRLRSLSVLLEDGKAEKASEELMKEVKGLQNSDGGWSWCSGMESSEYITRTVLSRFAMMKRNGNLSSEANAMVRKGVSYCDKKVYEDYVKSKHHFSTYDLLDYLYIRSGLESGNGSTGFSSLKGKALKAISEEWKTFGISEKAVAAMVMARSKGYEKYAGEILESLKQYAVKDENRGWQFANIEEGSFYRDRLKATTLVLEAFAEIEPKAEAVDGLRQWLVLQKETEDWGVDSNTAEVIQAILDSGSDWISSTSLPEIKIGGKTLRIDNAEQPAGLATITLDSRKVSGKELMIAKNSEVPSWGAVICQYVAPIKEVRSESCENLKIEKQLLKITGDGNGETAVSGDLQVGDRVRVTLTVTCEKDMDYVAIVDERAACLSPDEQLSGYTFNDGRGMYREVRDTRTSLFLYNLPKGVNVFSYDCHVDRAGEYANGIATVQSLYSPQQVAHSGGEMIRIGN